jgi:acyl-CoA synthetase (AMP-forming)/AMP-acid ligase II
MNPSPPPEVVNHPVTKAFEATLERPMTLGGLLRAVTTEHADRQAIAFRGEAIGYRDLWQRAQAVAKALVAAGAGKGTRVGILMASRPEFMAAAYGIGLIGGVVVLMHSVATARERDYMLRHSDCAVLLMQSAFQRQNWVTDVTGFHPDIATQPGGDLRIKALPFLRRVVCLEAPAGVSGIEDWSTFIARGASISDDMVDAMEAQVHASDDAVMIYTSGSTGSPKAVVHRHRAACVQQWRTPIIFGMAKDERVWSLYPLFWSAGFAFFPGVLTSGACMVMQDKADPAETLEIFERERVTMLASAVPTLAPLADHPDVTKRDLSSIRHLPTTAGLRRHLTISEKVWGPTASWGMSETFANVTYLIPDEADPLTRPGGYPMPGVTFRILDPATGAQVKTGELGEIAMTGFQIMRGYYKRNPEEYCDADGYVKTGDQGFIDRYGRLQFVSRLSNMIKTKGANVSPVEIEDVLMRWGKVKLAFVVGIPHKEHGEDVVACVVRRDDLPIEAGEIVAYLRQELASYKAPPHVLFMQADEIPMTVTNKPKLADLREKVLGRLAAAAAA